MRYIFLMIFLTKISFFSSFATWGEDINTTLEALENTHPIHNKKANTWEHLVQVDSKKIQVLHALLGPHLPKDSGTLFMQNDTLILHQSNAQNADKSWVNVLRKNIKKGALCDLLKNKEIDFRAPDASDHYLPPREDVGDEEKYRLLVFPEKDAYSSQTLRMLLYLYPKKENTHLDFLEEDVKQGNQTIGKKTFLYGPEAILKDFFTWYMDEFEALHMEKEKSPPTSSATHSTTQDDRESLPHRPLRRSGPSIHLRPLNLFLLRSQHRGTTEDNRKL